MGQLPPTAATAKAIEGLDAVPWASLEHAYGTAEDVPDLILAIALGDEKTRSEAWSALYGNIWHQGTVYEATAPAIPFLMRLFLDRQREDRRDFGHFLAYCTKGTSFLEVHRPYLNQFTADDERRLSIELRWVNAVHVSLARFADDLRQIIDDPAEPSEAQGCSYAILIANPLTYRKAMDSLANDLRSQSWAVRAWAAMASRAENPLSQEQKKVIEQALQDESDEVVRVCLAYGTSRSDNTAVAQKAFDRLASLYLDPDEAIEQRFIALGLEAETIEQISEEACLAGNEVMLTSLTNEMCRRLSLTIERDSSTRLVHKLLAVAFPNPPLVAGKRNLLELTERQKQVLFAMATNGHIWPSPWRLGVLSSLGLPDTREALLTFLGCDPPAKSTCSSLESSPVRPPEVKFTKTGWSWWPFKSKKRF